MSEKQPKKKKTAGDIVLTVVLIAAICVFCYAAFNLYHIYTEYKKGTDEYNSISEMAVTERDPDEVEEMKKAIIESNKELPAEYLLSNNVYYYGEKEEAEIAG